MVYHRLKSSLKLLKYSKDTEERFVTPSPLLPFQQASSCNSLTHLCRMDLCTLISRNSSFPNFGVLMVFYIFFSNFNKTFCKLTVKILIRHRIMHCLIWVVTVCQCPPSKNTLGLYGLRENCEKALMKVKFCEKGHNSK